MARRSSARDEKAGQLLDLMQAGKFHLAIVVMILRHSGLVTLEDCSKSSLATS